MAVASASSDCALIHERWVVTRAGSVAAARTTDGALRVRIGDGDFAVEQLVYHPKWTGGAKHDVTLLKLSEPVPSFPLLPPPGEFPAHSDHVVANALPDRNWVSKVTGGSPLWVEDRACSFPRTARVPGIFGRVRELVRGWGSERDDG